MNSNATIPYLGVDPGVSGGISLMWGDRKDSQIFPIPESEGAVWAYFEQLRTVEKGFACIERVGGYIPSERKDAKHGGQPGSTMFTFGQSYGMLRMALLAAGFEDCTDGVWTQKCFVSAPPKRWQKQFNLTLKGKTYTQRKRILCDRAKALPSFPSEKVTLKTCDSALIATYCAFLFGAM